MIARDFQNVLIFLYVLMECCLRGKNYGFIVKKKKYHITALSVLAVVELLKKLRQPVSHLKRGCSYGIPVLI